MKILANSLATSLFLVSWAQADWTVSSYPVAAPDSAAARREYGIRAFSNPASSTRIRVEGGRVLFHADYASEATEGASAEAGFDHDLNLEDRWLDQSGLTSISFRIRISAPLTGGMEVFLGSAAYSDSMLAAGAVFKHNLRGLLPAGGDTGWKTVELEPKDFYIEAPSEVSRPKLEDVLKRMTHLRFSPRTSFRDSATIQGAPCADCLHPTMSSLDLEVRDILLKGTVKYPWPNPGQIGCDAWPSFLLDDFADGGTSNKWGGFWYEVTDSGSVEVAEDLSDPSKGSSRSTLAITGDPEGNSGMATFSARLDRKLGSATHADAGWASLRTGLMCGGIRSDVDATIRFPLKMEYASAGVEEIRLNLYQDWLTDSVFRYARLPISQLPGGEWRTVCLRQEDFRVPKSYPSSSPARYDQTMLGKISWEVRMANQGGVATDTASVRFSIGKVELIHWSTVMSAGWSTCGDPDPDGVRGRPDARKLTVQSAGGILRLSGIQGITRMEVLTQQGRNLASFAPASSVPLSLPRGTYHLVGIHAGGRVVRSFAVVR